MFPTISLGSCSWSNNEINNDKKEEERVEEVLDWKKDVALKILTMENSFSDDSMEYVANIAKDIGIKNIKFGKLFIGGCSLSKHYNNAIKDLKHMNIEEIRVFYCQIRRVFRLVKLLKVKNEIIFQFNKTAETVE